jgi:hypothetical protein
MVRGSGLEADARVNAYHQQGWLMHPESPHEDSIAKALRNEAVLSKYTRLMGHRRNICDQFSATYPHADEFFERSIVDGTWDEWRDPAGNLSRQRIEEDLTKLDQSPRQSIFLHAPRWPIPIGRR